MVDDDQVLTRAAFCKRNHISITKYRAMKRDGRGPKCMIDEGRIELITLDEEKNWRAARAAETASSKHKLEAERRSAYMRELGLRAAASPNHISRRRLRPKRRKVSS